MSTESTPTTPKPETPAAEALPPQNAPQGAPKPGAPRPGNKAIPDKWQRGGPPKAKPNPDAGVPRTFGEFKPNKRALDATIEDELKAAFAGTELTAMDEDRPQAAKGEGGRKKGRVVSIHGKDVFIEIPGGRSEGMISLDEFEGKRPNVGDEIEFMVDHYDSANGLLVLTKEGAAKQVTDWSSVKMNMVIEAKITGMNKNSTGYTVEVNGIRGFMPLSQADMYRIEQPETLVNQKLKVQVIELEPSERNLIVSRRVIQEAERERKAVDFWATIKEGDIHKGVVKSIKAFGAFVDLGAADGLIPIGELSYSRVGTAEEVVKVGQLVEVKVIRLDPEARKIGLSLRAMGTNPWDTFAAENRPGLRIPGKVTRLADFGAFVEIAPGIEGLIHISELSTGRVGRVRDILSEGQEVTVQIINIDTEQRRIGLSLKAMTAEKEASQDAAATAETEADKAEAAARMANRKPSGNLRGGVGGGNVRFEIG